MKYGIREHAVLYALLVRYTLETAGESAGKELTARFTEKYGELRGARMRSHTDAEGKPADITSFLIYGEWAGEPGENISSLSFPADETISEVTRCAWYDNWKKYDLLPYGPYYCRYIDQAICRGYSGEFSLDVRESFGGGDGRCIFCWSQKTNPERLADEKKKNGTRWIRPFSFHCRELLEAYRLTVSDELMCSQVLHRTEAAFTRLFPDADVSVFR